MAYRSQIDQLQALARLRRNGQRPIGPVIVTEAVTVFEWATLAPNGLFAIRTDPGKPLGEHVNALAGLDVFVLTFRPFPDWQDRCIEILAVSPRLLHLIDRAARKRTHIVIDPWVAKESAA